MNVLLTGATGFLGSYVLAALVRDGHDVTCLLRPESDCWRIEDLRGKFRPMAHDPADPAGLARMMTEVRPQTVVHMAWAGVGNAHRNNPQQHDNVAAALALVRAAAEAGAAKWVGLGSQAEYGAQQNVISERCPTRPTTLYGQSKLTTCTSAERLCAETGMGFAWLRLFSSYGPKDHGYWMIPSLILSLLDGSEPELTQGTQLWDYIYATDVAAAVAAVATTGEATGVFNLGSGEARSLRSVIELIRDMIDPSLPLGFGKIPFRPDQVMHLQADISRLRASTGWAPRVPLEVGLRETVDWYQANAYRFR